jgi:ribosomal protein L16 Arg81 hydroxylase
MQTLANFDSADFVANYWQRKPLVIRKALAGFADPTSWPGLPVNPMWSHA